MNKRDLMNWAERHLNRLAGDHLITAAKAEALDSFYYRREARQLEGVMFRIRWCIERAKANGNFDCLQTEFDRAHDNAQPRRVGSGCEHRTEETGPPGSTRHPPELPR